MVGDGDISSVPLSALTNESRSVLSSLLNPKKVLPIVGPDQLSRHRDWRGLASLAQISSEIAANINECRDKTSEVLTIWSRRVDGSATVGQLVEYLQVLDRYDVCDDLIELAARNRLIVRTNGVTNNAISNWEGDDSELITFEDKLLRCPQRYNAYVLYAPEDKPFVDDLISRMRAKGFKLCTEENLLLGHAAKIDAVSRLILERCRYIVLILSPDFLRSPANTFYANMAQTHAINKNEIKLIPVMYRECLLPDLLAQYHRLPYLVDGQLYPHFWEKLALSLRVREIPDTSISAPTPTNTSIFSKFKHITDVTTTKHRKVNNGYKTSHLVLPDVPTNTVSLNDLDKLDVSDTRSLSTSSQSSEKKKKTNLGTRIFNSLKWKKHKIAVKTNM